LLEWWIQTGMGGSNMNRETAARIAEETLEILDVGYYFNPLGQRVNLEDMMRESVSGTVLYRPDDTDRLLETVAPAINRDTVIEVTNETTLAAAKRLSGTDSNLCCLNFASAKHPGGGFLQGSLAQEESLARSSGLYPTIAQMTEMYEYNANLDTALYSDYMIFSPHVPVFRNDDGQLLVEPYRVSFITAPAVNAGAVREREPDHVMQIHPTMQRRIEKILAVALAHNQETLVLGAFGCGVFRNSPDEVASIFHDVLSHPPFKGAFQRVVFAVYDRSPNQANYRSFLKLKNLE